MYVPFVQLPKFFRQDFFLRWLQFLDVVSDAIDISFHVVGVFDESVPDLPGSTYAVGSGQQTGEGLKSAASFISYMCGRTWCISYF